MPCQCYVELLCSLPIACLAELCHLTTEMPPSRQSEKKASRFAMVLAVDDKIS